jgi:hypothetical protein
MRSSTPRRPLETALVIGAPLCLAVLELFHPRPHDLFTVDLSAWMLVHYLQIPLFPLAALALARLVRDRADWAAALCGVAMFVFAVSYVAFDTAAGVVTGILLQASRASPAAADWRSAVLAVWTHPVMGGAAQPPPLLAVIGSVAWSLGAVAAAITVRRAGSSWGPVLLLGISAFGLGVFRTHAWPGGPVTFGSLAVATAWLRMKRARYDPAPVSHAA